MALRGVDNPKEDPAREAEAFLRIASVVTQELPAITSPHWHRALEATRDRLCEAAGRRPQFLRGIDGEAS